MSELFEIGQIVNIIPQDFRNANKGKIIEINDKSFSIEVKLPPIGLLINNLIEFYSQTKNGVLYFQTDINKIQGNVVIVDNPIKHRFLQRRKFTRINYNQDMELVLDEKPYQISTLDLSAGGMKLKSKNCINLDCEYKVKIKLSHEQEVCCKFQPIRIEKGDSEFYTVSGRFKNQSNIDKMTLVQFCMQKNLELVNK